MSTEERDIGLYTRKINISNPLALSLLISNSKESTVAN